ncbi:MAG: histidine kinase dimerization/phospho-acceptor domain-containing protein, partial [Phycisphaerae bacterium]
MADSLTLDDVLFDDFFDDGCEVAVLPFLQTIGKGIGVTPAPAVGLVNARGTLLAVGHAGMQPSLVIPSSTSIDVAEALRSGNVARIASEDGGTLLIAPAHDLQGPRGALVVAFDRATDASALQMVEMRVSLELIAQLAFNFFDTEGKREEAAQRVKQLVAEQRTLVRDHKLIVETNLNDREAAMHEKQALIADLENQVEMRTQQLSAAKQRAEIANADKSRFLANMSHEIRTPMTAILGFTDLMLSGDVDPVETQHALQTIRRNGDHLLTLINDILDLSKIESGKLPIESLDTCPTGIITDVMGLLG